MDELAKFREEWKEEVRQRKGHKQIGSEAAEKENRSHNKAYASPSTSASKPPCVEAQIPTNALANQTAKTGKSTQNKSATSVLTESYLTPEQNVSNAFKAERPEHVYHNALLSKRDLEAIDLFEQAVDMEHAGQMSDAVKHYRLAFKKNEKVDKLYREKYYSKSASGAGKSTTLQSASARQTTKSAKAAGADGMTDLIQKFARLDMDRQPMDAHVSSARNDNGEQVDGLHMIDGMHITALPYEVISHILEKLALMSLGSFTQCTYTCRRLAYVGYSSQRIWRSLCMQTFSRQHYNDEMSCTFSPVDDKAAHTPAPVYPSWRIMYLNRPRIRFDGVYISTCNYLRPGLAQTWNNPLHMVTYYRYVRFYADGTCMNLLTTAPPVDVVPVFTRGREEDEENVSVIVESASSGDGAANASVVYKRDDGTVLVRPKGITYGTWQITSIDGQLHIETEGSVDRYLFYMDLQITSSGHHRHNKLKWHRFWSVNKLTQDEADFSLRNDKAYFFVRSKF